MELINPADFVLTHIFFLSMSILFLLILDTNFCFERHFDRSGHFSYFERSENKVTGILRCVAKFFLDKNFSSLKFRKILMLKKPIGMQQLTKERQLHLL